MNTWAVLSRKRLLVAILVAMACAICVLASPALAQPATQDTNDQSDNAAVIDEQESDGEGDAATEGGSEGGDVEGDDEGDATENADSDATDSAEGEGQKSEGAGSVNPKIQAEEYTITVKASKGGKVTVKGALEKASEGDTVTLEVTPEKGSALSSLKYTAGSDSASISAAEDGTYSFEMPGANVEIEAVFAGLYKVTTGKTSNGTIKLDGPDGKDATELEAMKGEIVTLSATPNNKSYAVKSVTCKLKDSPKNPQDITDSLNKDGKYVFKMADSDVEVNAEFALLHAITVNKVTNGTVKVTDNVTEAIEGKDVEVTAKPFKGYELTKITYTPKNGKAKSMSKGKSGAYTFAMPNADVSIDATFTAVPETYTVTVATATGGTVTSNVKAASEGDTVALTVSPSSGYSLSSLSYTTADGKSTSISAPVNGKTTFKMPASDVTVNPVFTRAAATSYTITFDKNATDATGTMNAQTVQAGQATPLTANTFKRTGYTFKSWNTARDGKGTTYSDKANITPTANMTLYAQWTKSSTASTAASGGKTPKTGDTLPVGALVATGLVVAIASLGAAMYARRRMTKR